MCLLILKEFMVSSCLIFYIVLFVVGVNMLMLIVGVIFIWVVVGYGEEVVVVWGVGSRLELFIIIFVLVLLMMLLFFIS